MYEAACRKAKVVQSGSLIRDDFSELSIPYSANTHALARVCVTSRPTIAAGAVWTPFSVTAIQTRL